MATNPTSKNASYAFLEARSAIVGTGRQARLAMVFYEGANPQVPVDATVDQNLGTGSEGLDAIFAPRNTDLNFDWSLATDTTNAIAEVGTLGVGFFLFRDNQDGAGAGTSRVRFYNLTNAQEVSYNFPVAGYSVQDGTTLTAIAGADLAQPGTYKVVPVLWNINDQSTESNTTPPTMAQVVAGANDNEFYIDADNNVVASGGVAATPALNTFVTGRVAWIRVEADVQSITPNNPSTNQKYGDTPDITYDITSNTLNNPKQIRVGPIQPGASSSTAPVKTITQTPNTNGTRPASSTYNVDTAFPAGSTSHTIRIYVGPRGGQSSTPAGETPDLLASGTLRIPDTNDKAWVVFGTPASGVSFIDSYAVSRTTAFNIGSGIHLKSNSGLSADGVNVFNNSGRTQANKLFRRVSASGDETNARAFLQTWVADAFGAALVSKNITLAMLRHTDSAVEDTQNLITDANGKVEWSVLMSRTVCIAFNRFKKAGGDTIAGAPMSITSGNVHAANPSPITDIDPAYTGKTFAGPYPAYPKHIKLTGRVYGSNEPVDTETNIFGVNSEGHVVGAWTGSATQATEGANDAPNGVGGRNKNLGTGTIRWKLSSEYNEGNGTLYQIGRTVLRDVAGRQISTSVNADRWRVRYAVWNTSIDASAEAETDAGVNGRLEGVLGYQGSFQIINAPQDPSVLKLWAGFHDQDVDVPNANWDVTGDGSVEGPTEVGWNVDTGNYGQISQAVQFIAVDPDLTFFVTSNKLVMAPDESIIITARMVRLLPDNNAVSVTPDAPLAIKILRRNAVITVVAQGVMTQIGATDDYEYSFSPTEAAAFSALITGFKSGSRPPDAGDIAFVSNRSKEGLSILVQGGDPTNPEQHWYPGKTLVVGGAAYDSITKRLRISSSSKIILLRSHPSLGPQYLDSSYDWQSAVGVDVYEHSLSEAAPGARLYTLIIPGSESTSWGSYDISLEVRLTIDGVSYSGSEAMSVLGDKNAHDSYAFDGMGFAIPGFSEK